jgi:peptide/nickel transport system permease protein
MKLRVYIVRRLLLAIPVLLIVVISNFILIHIAPGDPATIMAGPFAQDPVYIQAMRVKYGLDKSLPEQLFIYLANILRGDFGYSYSYGKPVLEVISSRMPASLLLIATGGIASILIGIFVGVICAMRYGKKTDTALSFMSLVTFSMPIFWLGLMLMLVFALRLHWFPTSGMMSVVGEYSAMGRGLDILWHLFLPVASIVLVWFGEYVRITRASIAEVMNEDFITTARAIGYSERTIFFKQAFRNALLPVVSVAGMELGMVLVGGTVMAETVFAWPGMGSLMFDAIKFRDYPLLMGNFIIMCVIVVVATLITDVVYGLLDPRVEY